MYRPLSNNLCALLLSACSLLAIEPAKADVVECTNLKILRVTPEGSRDDGFNFQNKLIVEIADQSNIRTTCSGAYYLYLPSTDSNYNRILAVATTALLSGRSVSVAVNNSSTTTLSGGTPVAVMIAYIALQ